MKNTLPRSFALGAFALAASVASAAQTIYVDFGNSPAAGTGWNSLGSAGTAYSVANLVDSANATTTIGLDVNGGFGTIGAGVAAGTVAFSSTATGQTHTFVSGAVSDYLAGTTSGVFTFTGLDSSKTYALEFFSSRSNPGGGRNTQFTVSNGGLTSSSVLTLDAGDNVSGTAFLSSFTPSISGQITVTLAAIAPTNGFYYINAMAITEVSTSAVPEPSSFAAVAGLGILGFAGMRRRRR